MEVLLKYQAEDTGGTGVNAPLFSCVIPVKGARPYMDEALESLESQGMGDDIEVIIQDGDVEPDAGQSDALNRGFAKARGEWLFWLNADDVLLPGALKKVRALITSYATSTSDEVAKAPSTNAATPHESTISWIAGDTVYLDEKGIVKDVRIDAKWRPWFGKHLGAWAGGPSAFFKRELWEKRGGFDAGLKYVMDIDLWTRWAKAGVRYFELGDYVWGFRVHDGSKTMGGKNLEEHRAERTYLMSKHGVKHETFWRNLTRAASVLDGSWMKRRFDSVRLRGYKYNMVAE